MLTRLNIQSFALIESLDLDLKEGLQVFTGETGAGKSIFVKALVFLSGGKVSPDVIRKGHDSAEVIGYFEADAEDNLMAELSSQDIPVEVQSEKISLLIRRNLRLSGVSHAWINGVPLTLNVLRKISGSLLRIISQHENLKIFDPKFHQEFLDSFLEKKEVLSLFQKEYRDIHKEMSQISEFLLATKETAAHADEWQRDLKELIPFAPSHEDFEGLKSRIKQQREARQLAEFLSSQEGFLEQGYNGNPLSLYFRNLAKNIEKNWHPSGTQGEESLVTICNDLAIKMEELSYFFAQKKAGKSPADEWDAPASLEHLEERLSTYSRFFRKYHLQSARDLQDFVATLQSSLSSFQQRETKIRDDLSSLQKNLKRLKAAEKALHEERLGALSLLQERVFAHLKDLGLAKVCLEGLWKPASTRLSSEGIAELTPSLRDEWMQLKEELGKIGPAGSQTISLLFSANPGEPLMPLDQVASGGESSRILLALLMATPQSNHGQIYVFDEIDVGVSGRAADKVGSKLRSLSQEAQILLISHLPQVSAYGTQHYLIEKEEVGGRTHSLVRPLGIEEREKEIARLLSGAALTKLSRSNARELLERAQDRLS